MGWIILLIVIVIAIAALAHAKRPAAAAQAASLEWTLAPRDLMNATERKFFWRLQEALPDHAVFAQVALSQLVKKPDNARQALWNKIDRKVVDFVVCNAELRVLAVVETDGPTHSGKKQRQRDADKSAALAAAGYRLLRFSTDRLPSGEEIRAALAEPKAESQEEFAEARRPPAAV